MLVKEKNFRIKSSAIKKPGFTLAEILVVVVIMVVIGSFSLFLFERISHRSAVSANAEQVKQLILQAKNIALTGQGLPVGNSYLYSLIRVEFNRTAHTAQILLVRPSGGTIPMSGTQVTLDVEKIIFGKLQIANGGTSYSLCSKTTSSNLCSIDFFYGGSNAGQIEAHGVYSGNPYLELVNNYSAGDIKDVEAYKIEVDRLTGDPKISKDASFVR